MSNQLKEYCTLLEAQIEEQERKHGATVRALPEFKKLEEQLEKVEQERDKLQSQQKKMLGEDAWEKKRRMVESFKLEFLQAKLLSDAKKEQIVKVLTKYGLIPRQIEAKVK